MSIACACDVAHPPRLVVVTGGPGAGKTALLEVVQNNFCRHVVILPEAATILWHGGFPRRDTVPARRAAQRAIVRVQLELQRMALEEGTPSLIVCDRGTLDGAAYWPGDADEYYAELGINRDHELARYAAVIHMQPPPRQHGYQQTLTRPESAEQAAVADERILAAWAGHPRRLMIPSDADFLRKIETGVTLLRDEVPHCCRG